MGQNYIWQDFREIGRGQIIKSLGVKIRSSFFIFEVIGAKPYWKQ